MRIFRFSIALIALSCLAGWLWLRKPYSPTDELPAVAYTAFNVEVPDSVAGLSLAKAARGWKGVTASTFNPASGLLVVSHTAKTSERDLMGRLQILSSKPVSKKIFPEPVGAKCPVPQAALAALPNWLLGAGIVLGLGFVALSITRKKPGTLELLA
jgi:hypothetical protein